MRCRNCGQKAMRIDLSLTADRRATMSWCAGCDTRSWESDGEVIDLADVLGALPRGLKARRPKSVSAPAATTMSDATGDGTTVRAGRADRGSRPER